MTTALSSRKGLRALTSILTLVFVVMGLSACASETETEPVEAEEGTQTEAPAGQQGPAGDQQATVEGTIQALQGGVTNLAPATAAQNIQSWQTQLENASDPALSEIASNLEELNGLIQERPIDGQAVGQLLSELGEQTTSAASNAQGQMATQLEQLGSTLSQAGQSLTSGEM